MRKLLVIVALEFLVLCSAADGQNKIEYGNNSKAGHYLNVGDARIYYEVYGQGAPIVLLHGGLFGYISEYEHLIPKLAKTNQVIAIATRGHGRSEIGTKPFSYQLLAEDAYQVIKSLTKDSVIVIGFSTGGNTAYMLTDQHPETVKKLISIGASPQATPPNNKEKSDQAKEEKLTGITLEKEAPDFVKERKALMPEPGRWNEFVDKITTMWESSEFLTDDQIRGIKSPVLIIAGDKDPHVNAERVIQLYRLLPESSLSIIPDCGHVVLYCNFAAAWASIAPFIHVQQVK